MSVLGDIQNAHIFGGTHIEIYTTLKLEFFYENYMYIFFTEVYK